MTSYNFQTKKIPTKRERFVGSVKNIYETIPRNSARRAPWRVFPSAIWAEVTHRERRDGANDRDRQFRCMACHGFRP